LFLKRRHQECRYDLIHVHNVPDFLVFSAWYPKWNGAKVILDIHDIVPELFASKFKSGARSKYVTLLKAVEKLSAKFADHIIVSNHLWQETLISRSVSTEKCSVYLNNVDLALFYPHARRREDGKIIIIFPGSFQWHQGLDLAIEAFAQLKKKLPNAEFHLWGGGSTTAELLALAERLGVSDSVKYLGVASMEQMPELIANADLGIVPKRADSFGNEAYSTKIMEFMSQGVAVVLSRTKIDSFYFNDSVVRFFESGNIQQLAEAMLEVINNKELRQDLIEAGHRYVEQNSWESRRSEYLDLVDDLSTEVFPDPEAPAVEAVRADR
jgi:glycosyltransferase involved in cell wall biosynthesis